MTFGIGDYVKTTDIAATRAASSDPNLQKNFVINLLPILNREIDPALVAEKMFCQDVRKKWKETILPTFLDLTEDVPFTNSQKHLSLKRQTEIARTQAQAILEQLAVQDKANRSYSQLRNYFATDNVKNLHIYTGLSEQAEKDSFKRINTLFWKASQERVPATVLRREDPFLKAICSRFVIPYLTRAKRIKANDEAKHLAELILGVVEGPIDLKPGSPLSIEEYYRLTEDTNPENEICEGKWRLNICNLERMPYDDRFETLEASIYKLCKQDVGASFNEHKAKVFKEEMQKLLDDGKTLSPDEWLEEFDLKIAAHTSADTTGAFFDTVGRALKKVCEHPKTSIPTKLMIINIHWEDFCESLSLRVEREAHKYRDFIDEVTSSAYPSIPPEVKINGGFRAMLGNKPGKELYTMSLSSKNTFVVNEIAIVLHPETHAPTYAVITKAFTYSDDPTNNMYTYLLGSDFLNFEESKERRKKAIHANPVMIGKIGKALPPPPEDSDDEQTQ